MNNYNLCKFCIGFFVSSLFINPYIDAFSNIGLIKNGIQKPFLCGKLKVQKTPFDNDQINDEPLMESNTQISNQDQSHSNNKESKKQTKFSTPSTISKKEKNASIVSKSTSENKKDDKISSYEKVKNINLKMTKKRSEIEQFKESPFDALQTMDIIIDKALDTIEDASLMFRRQLDESLMMDSKLKSPPSADALNDWNNENTIPYRPRILVIGSGWASHAFMKCIDTNLYRVLVVSPTNYFVFTPMLASSSVGTTEIRSIVESTRESNPFVKFLEGKGIDMDIRSKILKVKLGEGDIVDEDDENDQEIIEIQYDKAIYCAGVGPISSSKKIPGLGKKNVYFLKTVQDARRLRSGVISLLEKASQPNLSEETRKQLLTFVVVGGGPTGVEYCGELIDFLNDVTGQPKQNDDPDKKPIFTRSIVPFASLAPYTKVILIQGGDSLLPMFDESLREFAKVSLEKEGVEVRTRTKVASIIDKGKDKKVLVLSIANDNTKDYELTTDEGEEGSKEELECGLLVWAGGTKPVKLTENLLSHINDVCKEKSISIPSSTSETGRIAVDRWQRVLGSEGSLLAIGDASATVDDNENVSALPQTAQVAAQQGAYVARLLNREYDLSGKSKKNDKKGTETLLLPPPINQKAEQGDIAKILMLRGKVRAKPFQFLNLGQLAYTGGGEALSQVELGDKPLFSQAGSVGFLLWRSVYVVKQVNTKTRLLVLFDWFKTRIFGRDVTRM